MQLLVEIKGIVSRIAEQLDEMLTGNEASEEFTRLVARIGDLSHDTRQPPMSDDAAPHNSTRECQHVMGSPQLDEPTVQTFGSIGVELAGEWVSISGIRQRRFLALLVARAGVVVSVDWLAEYLWDDEDRPSAPGSALRTCVSRLRQALPEHARAWVKTEPSGYRFTAPAGHVDHVRFTELLGEARLARERNDVATASRLLDEALGLWRGDPFREIEHLEWVRPLIERLHLDRLDLLEERWEVALAQGRHSQIISELAVFTAEHGLRDRATRQYVLALHRCGRTAEALRAINDHRLHLATESGLEPSAGIVELEYALLIGDRSLG